MCLGLTKDWRRNRAAARNHRNSITAYKVLRISVDDSALIAPFMSHFTWSTGHNISSRAKYKASSRVCPSSGEIRQHEVDEGFHLFRHLTDAKEFAKHDYNNHIFRVSIRPRDIIAVGRWRDCRSITAIRCSLHEEVK